MKKVLLTVWLMLLVACSQAEQPVVNFESSVSSSVAQEGRDAKYPSVQVLFAQKAEDAMVQGSGKVIRLLPDDNKGSRHQKFLLEVEGGQTILVAHNIDLALRINSLKIGDVVEFTGEYSYNAKGGVVHWTHLDPRNQHDHGWLKHNGITYQ